MKLCFIGIHKWEKWSEKIPEEWTTIVKRTNEHFILTKYYQEKKCKECNECVKKYVQENKV